MTEVLLGLGIITLIGAAVTGFAYLFVRAMEWSVLPDDWFEDEEDSTYL